MSRGGMVMLACLLALLVLAAGGSIWIWNAGEGPNNISLHGFIALALGVIGSLVVGGGLMALAFFSSRSGHDQAVHDESRTGPGVTVDD